MFPGASVQHVTEPEVDMSRFGHYVKLALKQGTLPEGLGTKALWHRFLALPLIGLLH